MGSVVNTPVDIEHALRCHRYKIEDEWKDQLFNQWIGEYLNVTKSNMLKGVRGGLLRPLRLRPKCCIFEAVMGAKETTNFDFVVLKVADTLTDDQTEHELNMLKSLQTFGPGIPSIVHESRIELPLEGEFASSKEFLRVALKPVGRCWSSENPPVKFDSAKELLLAGQQVLQIMKRLYDEFGVLHCDIKPSNIIFRDNSPELIDFGISCKRGGIVWGGSSDFLSESHALSVKDDDSFIYRPTLWDDIESLLFTLYAMQVGVTNYNRIPLRKVLTLCPPAHEIVLKQNLCALDMFSIATHDPEFSWHDLQTEIAFAQRTIT